jgi:hypothetical protein
MTCPRAFSGAPMADFTFLNRPDDGTCDYCGSLTGNDFMRRVEAGDVVLIPTDKAYKVYLKNDGGQEFKQSYRTDNSQSANQETWTWTTRPQSQQKFYFQHLSVAQMTRFVALLNAKKLKLDVPGHFYVTPYFVVREGVRP